MYLLDGGAAVGAVVLAIVMVLVVIALAHWRRP